MVLATKPISNSFAGCFFIWNLSLIGRKDRITMFEVRIDHTVRITFSANTDTLKYTIAWNKTVNKLLKIIYLKLDNAQVNWFNTRAESMTPVN